MAPEIFSVLAIEDLFELLRQGFDVEGFLDEPIKSTVEYFTGLAINAVST